MRPWRDKLLCVSRQLFGLRAFGPASIRRMASTSTSSAQHPPSSFLAAHTHPHTHLSPFTCAMSTAHSPCLALSSLISRATSSNFAPFLIFSSASSFLLCFSHRICRTLMLVAGFNLPLPPPPASFASPAASLPLPLFLGAIIGGCGVYCRTRCTISACVECWVGSK